ncbi:MAG: LamG-like jellyroll fold domain-containing protein, partial [Candidatus Paceibacterota bacterium]
MPYKGCNATDSKLADVFNLTATRASASYGNGINPYTKVNSNSYTTGAYNEPSHFDETYNIYLISRLDGPSPKLAKGLVDKAIYAEKYMGNTTNATAYIASIPYLTNPIPTICASINGTGAGYKCVYDAGLAGGPNATFHVGGESTYENVWNFTKPGAIASHFYSFTASGTIRTTASNGSVTALLISADVTGTQGNVAEPYADEVPQPTAFYKYFLGYKNYTYGESMFMSVRSVRWNWFSVGDPLYVLPEVASTDNEAPAITNVSYSWNGNNISIFWDNTYSVSGSPEVTYGYVNYGTNSSYGSTTNDSSPLTYYGVQKMNYLSQHNITIPLNSLGTYAFQINTTDPAGNAATYNFTYDGTAPTVTFVQPTKDNNSFININNTFINATSSEDNVSMTLVDTSLVLGFHLEQGSNNSKAEDYSQYGNNGSCTGNACPNYTTGKFGNGLQFDGTNDNMSVESSSSLNITGGMTLAAWVYKTSSGNGYVIAKRTNTYQGYNLFIQTNNLSIVDANGGTIRDLKMTIPLNNWHHAAIVINSSGTGATPYLDGIAGTTIAIPVFSKNNVHLMIGNREEGSSATEFNGTIDEAEVYNRPLSGLEISSKYNSSIGNYRQFETARTDIPEGNYTYRIEAIDMAGNLGQSETRIITSDTTHPGISFVAPTPSNNTVNNTDWLYVNVTTSDTNNLSSFIDFNRSLVAWYRFNNETGENSTFVKDWSNFGNNGTCSGNTCPNTTTAGAFGSAKVFDGTDDSIDLGPSPITNITGKITVEAWIKPEITSGEENTIASKSSSLIDVEGWNFYIDYVYSTGGIGATMYPYCGGYGNNANITGDGKWHYAAFTNNPTGDITVYLDGKIVYNGTGCTALEPVANTYIGSEPIWGWKLNGSIDEVKIWNRVLSYQELNASYNTGLYKLKNNFTGLSNGTYNYTAYTQDLAGNMNQTGIQMYSFDSKMINNCKTIT